MYISRLLIFMLTVMILLPGSLMAQSASGGSSSIGFLFDMLIMVVILVCFLMAMKVFSLLRGGELASGWQMLAIAFIILCLGQLFQLGSTLEIISLNHAIVVTVRLAGVILLLLGIVRIKKVLS